MGIKVRVPAIKESFYSDSARPQVQRKLEEISLTYKREIEQASRLTNISEKMITSLIFIESSGKPNAVSSANAVGLMQLVPAAASDILVMENNKKRMTDDEKSLLRKYLGDRLDKGILAMKFLGDKKTVNGVTSAVWVTREDLLNPEFNILVGSIYLGILIDESVEDGSLRLDKIIVRYNRGYFSDGRGSRLPSSPEAVLAAANIPKETKDYIRKFAGINSTLHILKGNTA
jgi:soluble lytic murein transglycosylase-like protein